MPTVWEDLRRGFREHPIRTAAMLTAVVYVVGLMVVLAIGLFDQTATMVIREP